MSNRPLLARQFSLLEHLTNPASYLGGPEGAAIDADLAALDRRRLRLVGVLSLGKRFRKIEMTMPRTLAYLDADLDTLKNDFAEQKPPHSLRRYDNARQFYDFLYERWDAHPPEPAFVADVADFEIAYAKVLALPAHQPSDPGWASKDRDGTSVRCCRDVELVDLAHDIRPLFDDTAEMDEPVARPTCLAITHTNDAKRPAVFEIAPEVRAILETLQHWCPLSDIAGEEEPEMIEVFDRLAKNGLVEYAP